MPILERNDILLIADEVVTGFGRLGTMFGSDHFNMKPDLITIAKGLTSAYAPLSGSIVSEKVWNVLSKGTDENGPFGHGWTYSAHPIGAAAGIANLELIDKLGLVNNAMSWLDSHQSEDASTYEEKQKEVEMSVLDWDQWKIDNPDWRRDWSDPSTCPSPPR